MDKVCRVLICDDHPHAREAITAMLDGEDGFLIAGHAKNGQEAIELCGELKPDLVLMDINMPVVNGLEATKRIKGAFPSIKVIMLSISDDVADLFTAVQYGAQGYLLKSMDPDDWLHYLKALIEGKDDAARGLAGKLFGQFRGVEPADLEASLTPREKEILLLVKEGLTNREIAEMLSIAENTVKNHIKNLLEKLELDNRVQLAGYAVRHNIT
ncbi:DNA-binding response regulator [Neobacillus piezotolerans]|uniref:DNA-binding response regulator n=1 Tax=Neobacillus piezotolerans TaxID=2259171 RepID=A0A3D8GWV6_9BACI|nr:response regulator transcription factor [Neobacillus piezotolerans]RDU38872.1 DNA-binding response regulator [Neobacillus piezotolerans]